MRLDSMAFPFFSSACLKLFAYLFKASLSFLSRCNVFLSLVRLIKVSYSLCKSCKSFFINSTVSCSLCMSTPSFFGVIVFSPSASKVRSIFPVSPKSPLSKASKIKSFTSSRTISLSFWFFSAFPSTLA